MYFVNKLFSKFKATQTQVSLTVTILSSYDGVVRVSVSKSVGKRDVTMRMISFIILMLPVVLLLTVASSIENDLNDNISAQLVNATSSPTTRSISSDKGFQHYVRQEFEMLTDQAMILGNYHPNDKESRLRLQLKALQIEMAYTKNLRQMMLTGSNIATTFESSKESELKGDYRQQRRKVGNILIKINETICQAMPWHHWAGGFGYSSKNDDSIPVGFQNHHGYDFDWVDEYGSFGLYDELNCYAHAREQYKRLYTADDWTSLWQTFQVSSLYPYPIPNPTNRPYYASYSKGRGRGNFASRNITKGELIYDGYINTAFFQEGESFKRFVALLSREAACDVLEWSFMQDLTNDGNAVLGLDMDGGALFNDGSPNQNMEYKKKSSLDKYAKRDILQGEEITEIYEDFPKSDFNL